MLEKKEEINYDENGAVPCKYCKRKGKTVYPNVVEITGDELFYVQCPCCNNKKWDIYEFLGGTKTNAVKTWNRTMLNKSDFDDYID